MHIQSKTTGLAPFRLEYPLKSNEWPTNTAILAHFRWLELPFPSMDIDLPPQAQRLRRAFFRKKIAVAERSGANPFSANILNGHWYLEGLSSCTILGGYSRFSRAYPVYPRVAERRDAISFNFRNLDDHMLRSALHTPAVNWVITVFHWQLPA
jgi:hypothetical protein